MLTVLGSPKRLCDGVTRREALVAGGLSMFGLGLSDFFRLQDAQASEPRRERSFGQAKACILIFLYGSPSQLELADQKPNAPVEIRGELGSIRSTLPGCDVCELLPSVSRIMDKMTVVRSMTHPHPIHGVAYATTGTPVIDIPMELNPRDGRHHPYIGSVVDYLLRNNLVFPSPSGRGAGREGTRRSRTARTPDNIALPFQFSSHRVGEVPRAGPYGAFLGNAYNPLWTEFQGRATRVAVKTLQDQRFEDVEPYVGISDDSRFSLAAATNLGPQLTIDRLNQRRSLLQQLDQARREAENSPSGIGESGLDRYREMAYSLIGSQRIHAALDLGREPMALRDSYGMTLFGQGCLTARRLVEAGSKFVSVFWDEYGLAGSGWDTHWDHYNRMRNELMPGFDRGLAGLIGDLDQRGMLDDTLVMVLSEHGRTPRINNARGGGRDHWSQAYTTLFAGGGVARGRVVGRTDRHGATVTERPVSPKDVLATAYHLLGIDPHTLLNDRTGRPVPLVQDAHVVTEMLG
ncbi:MAG: DUF1501 domain-containing protein [Planctomycetes bacterium]|nr:DUF1501 domain-containing protein [Planctomycetota bacterium]